MAKRKRLTPANPLFLDDTPPAAPAMRAAPIADVAREAASSAAAEELAQTLTQAREQGRMVVSVPLEQIALDHLVRDRIAVDAEEMAALKSSIAARGQQTPVELVALGAAPSSSKAVGQPLPSSSEAVGQQYGLISGWRRIMALTALRDETGDARFGQVLALLRQPGDVAQAYQAMVEENEIRASLSHYERARIVAKAVEQGVFETERTALQTLFEAASRARRSKIGSFLSVVAELDGMLGFPAAMSERQGLALARGFDGDDSLGPRLRHALRKHRPDTPEAEQALIDSVLAAPPIGQGRPGGKADDRPGTPEASRETEPVSPRNADAPDDPTPAAAPRRVQVTTGISLSEDGQGRLVLEGNRVDAALKARLVDWLRGL